MFDDKQLSFAKPDGVAPVMISGDKVRQLVKEWCGKHMFAPNLASKYLEVKFISPQYIPFWVFRAHVCGEYSGRGGKDRTVTRKNSDGSSSTRTVTDWYPIHGTVSDDLENIGVSADGNINKEYSDFLFDSTPDDAFDEWKPEYFAGSYSFIPTVPVEDAEAQAKDDMKDELEEPQYTRVADESAVLGEYAHEVLRAEGKVAPQPVLPDEGEGVRRNVGALVEEARCESRAAGDESWRDDEDHERSSHAGLSAFPGEGEAE